MGVAAPQTYREDTHRRAPKHAFLGGGSAPLGLEEDNPTIAAMAVVELDGTCEIPER
jgi:hypothetical protein